MNGVTAEVRTMGLNNETIKPQLIHENSSMTHNAYYVN